MAICKSCGKKLPDGAIFCGYCGNKIEIVPSEEAVSDKDGSRKKSSAKKIILAILAALLVVSVVLFFTKPWNTGIDTNDPLQEDNNADSLESSEETDSVTDDVEPPAWAGQLKRKIITKSSPDGTIVSTTELEYDTYEREKSGILYDASGVIIETWETSYKWSVDDKEFVKKIYNSSGEEIRMERQNPWEFAGYVIYSLDVYTIEDGVTWFDTHPYKIYSSVYEGNQLVKKSEMEYAGEDEDGQAHYAVWGSWEYHYDDNGILIKKIQFWRDFYDYTSEGVSIGILDLSEERPDCITDVKTYEYDFDEKGHIITMYEYDSQGRLEFIYAYEYDFY